MLKAVLFDIDGVLLNSFQANLVFYQSLLQKAGYEPPTKKEFLPLFSHTMRDVIKVLTKSQSDDVINKIWEMGKTFPYPDHLLTIPKNAEKVVKELNNDYVLGVVTSRIGVPKIGDLNQYFQVAVTYQDTAKHKPNPEPLLFACEKLAVAASQAVYIGDVENDMIAAREAGMKSIGLSSTKFDQADATVTSFTELIHAIQGLD